MGWPEDGLFTINLMLQGLAFEIGHGERIIYAT